VSVDQQDVAAPDYERPAFGEAWGQSLAMRGLFRALERVAATNSTVLLQGETGTGKEVLAQAVHQASARRAEPLVVVDCGAVTGSLVESELFGHVKGAFTGAMAERKGAFLDANGGTVFLDEIGELPLEMQPKLLRVLETGTVKRLGEDAPRRVDVRVVAATHRNLESDVDAGRFRSDLYFRLAVVLLRVPPLRERAGDIPVLAQHFLQRLGRADFPLSAPLVEKLKAYAWPGNVRELRNVVERALAMGSVEIPSPSKVAARGGVTELGDLPYKEAKERLVESFTREYLDALLERCGRNLTAVARAAGIARPHLHRLVRKYGLKASDR
jgi:transcriptional regulator with GAF, ATPase, and Fis domain